MSAFVQGAAFELAVVLLAILERWPFLRRIKTEQTKDPTSLTMVC